MNNEAPQQNFTDFSTACTTETNFTSYLDKLVALLDGSNQDCDILQQIFVGDYVLDLPAGDRNLLLDKTGYLILNLVMGV